MAMFATVVVKGVFGSRKRLESNFINNGGFAEEKSLRR